MRRSPSFAWASKRDYKTSILSDRIAERIKRIKSDAPILEWQDLPKVAGYEDVTHSVTADAGYGMVILFLINYYQNPLSVRRTFVGSGVDFFSIGTATGGRFCFSAIISKRTAH